MGPGARFALWGGIVAAATGVALVGGAVRMQAPGLGWGVLGWGAAVAPGLTFGTWLARRHGTPGTGFVAALGAGILVRFVTVLGSLAWVLAEGAGAQRIWLAGVLAGYVPLQLFEVAWFVRRSRRLAAAR